MGDTVTHVLNVYIRTTPEKLWQALTDGSITKLYFFGTSVESSWKPGEPIRHVNADGSVSLQGEIIEIDPPRKLVTTFNPAWDANAKDEISRVSYEIEQMGENCKLVLTHSELLASSSHAAMVFQGWSQILSGLKSYLETGKALEFPQQM